MSRFQVYVEFTASTMVEVEAHSEQEAVDEAVLLVESTFAAELPGMDQCVPVEAEVVAWLDLDAPKRGVEDEQADAERLRGSDDAPVEGEPGCEGGDTGGPSDVS